jgi:hypothetical protein
VVVTIHQPEHLPWLGFCHKAAQADLFVLLDVVQFRKNYFQNRNRILGPNGPMWVTVPVLLKGHTEKTIAEMEIHNGVPWAHKWWSSLEHSYGRQPHFRDYAAFFEGLTGQSWRYLADLNEAIIRFLLTSLEIGCPIVRASTLGVSGARSALLLDICRRVGAKTYLAGRHGRDYLDEALFADGGVAVRYHEFDHPVYDQGSDTFVANLSSVDLLLRYGAESRQFVRSSAA